MVVVKCGYWSVAHALREVVVRAWKGMGKVEGRRTGERRKPTIQLPPQARATMSDPHIFPEDSTATTGTQEHYVRTK